MQHKIGVDVGGADSDQQTLLSACEEAKASFPIRSYVTDDLSSKTVECVRCSDSITMDDRVLTAVRRKKDSSLVRALSDLLSGEISALVTCSHTGAVVAGGALYLKRFSSLHHPALLTVLPSQTGKVIVLDVGAFVNASAHNLLEYACLGASFAQVECTMSRPRLGLLNIAEESGKGTPELQEIDRWLLRNETKRWEYMGNIEPAALFSGAVDILITNGFVGNILLKTAEGMLSFMDRSPADSLPTRPGAALLAGVRGLIFKCHGNSSQNAISGAIAQAEEAVSHRFVSHLEKEYASFSSLLSAFC